MDTWEAEQAARIGAAVKELRGKRTGQWLADRTTELGMKMTRQTITDLENGRRRYVTTAELAVLAAALNTAPIALLYPGPYDRRIEVLPGVDWPQEIDAVQWFSGISGHGWTDLGDLPDGPGAAGKASSHSRKEYQKNIRDLQRWRKLLDLYAERADLRAPENPTANDLKVHQLLLRNYNGQIRSKRLELGLDDINDLGEDDDGG